jgi:hypothetical protein
VEAGLVDTFCYEPLFSTGEIAALLASVTIYGVLAMANFAILGIAVTRNSAEALRACRILAGVDYVAGLAAYPIVGLLVGLPSAGEIAALMFLELSVLALIVGHRKRSKPPTPERRSLPRARAL